MADLAGTPPPSGMEESLNSPQPASTNSLAGAPPPEGMEQALYGDIGHQALAGLAGVARGATLGGSDLALTKTGLVAPETLKNLSAANPVTNFATNALGGAGLIAATGGIAAPIEGALGGAELAPIAARALGYGAEGAIFGAGNVVSDYALGDPNLTAGKIAADVGLGALFGAGLGAASSKLETSGLFSKKIADVADKANATAETSEALQGAGQGAEGTASSGGISPKPYSFSKDFESTSPESYIAAKEKFKTENPDKAEFLSPATHESLQNHKLYLTKDNVGYALSPEGDLQQVFNGSNRPGAGQEAVVHAIANGAKTLDAFDGYLPEYYNKFGFNLKNAEPWNPEYAPEGWNYEKYGTPDVVYMEYPESLTRNSNKVAARNEFVRAQNSAGIAGAGKGNPGFSQNDGLINWSQRGEVSTGPSGTNAATAATNLLNEDTLPNNRGFLSSEMKANAPELLKVSERRGYPVTEGMLSANKWDQQAEDALINGAPTFVGVRRAKKLADGFKQVVDDLNGIVDTKTDFSGGPLTKKSLGEALQGSISSKIDQESAPIQAMYEALQPHMEAINLPKSELTSASKELLAMPEARTSFPEGTLVKRVAKDLVNLKTVDDLKNYKSALNRSISPTASPGEKYMVGQLADKIAEIEENSIVKAANDSGLPADAKDLMKGLLTDKAAADAKYKPFRKDLNTLTEQLGKKNAGGPATAAAFIKDLDPETLSNRLFDKKYSAFNDFFQKKFPEEFALLQQYQKQVLKDTASKTGEFSPKVFFNKVNELEPEIRAKIFGSDELAKIKDAETWIRNLPKNFNPSGTSGMSAFRAFFESPAGAALANARDFGIEQFLKARSALPESIRGNPFEVGAEAADKFNKLNAVQSIANDFDKQLVKSSKSIFSASDAGRGATLSAAGQGIDKSYDKASKSVTNLADNPSGIVDHMAYHTGDLHNSLPNVTQSLNNTAMTALQFLNSKVPKAANNLPYNAKFEASDAQKKQFMRYYTAVNNPLHVLDDVRNGTLSNESMEAMQAVHPALLKQMQEHVLNAGLDGKDKTLSYAKKIAIAKFMGHPLDSNMLPQAIQANQIALSGPQQAQQGVQKQGRGKTSALAKAKFAGRAETDTQRLEADRE